jgi:serine/threonine protein kinase
VPQPLAAHSAPGTLTLTSDVTSDPSFASHVVIDSVIATTPTATVYRAVYGPVDAPKAPSLVLKIFKGFKYTDKMRREVDAVSKLRHANIVPYYGASDRDGVLWLMSEIELAALPTVASACHHTFTEQQIAVVAKSLLSALTYLHSKGQVARYIRPENVLINEDGVVKLADYGLQLLRQAAENALGGSRDPAILAKDNMYLAPEMRGVSPSLKESKSASLHALEATAKSDIWAMAVTLIQLSEERAAPVSGSNAPGSPPRSEPTSPSAMSPLSPRRGHSGDPDGSTTPTSPSGAPARSMMLQSRSSLMMNNPFQDFISKCLVPRADQRSDAASLLKHPFITRYAGGSASSALAQSAEIATGDSAVAAGRGDLHQPESPFKELLFRFKQLRRRRSQNTTQIKTQRISTHDRVISSFENMTPPVEEKSYKSKGHVKTPSSSSSKDDRPKLVSKDSRGSNASSSSLESEEEIISEMQALRDEFASFKQATADKMFVVHIWYLFFSFILHPDLKMSSLIYHRSKLESRLRDALDLLQVKDTQITVLKAQLSDLNMSRLKDKEEMKREMRSSLLTDIKREIETNNSSNSINGGSSHGSSAELTKNKNTSSESLRGASNTSSPSGSPGTARSPDRKTSAADKASEPTLSGSTDSVSAPSNKKLSLLAALSLEGAGAAAATENHTATTPANPKEADSAGLSSGSGSKSSAGFTKQGRARGESAYTGPVQRPTLLTSSSRILDRIKFFEEAVTPTGSPEVAPKKSPKDGTMSPLKGSQSSSNVPSQ